MFNNINHFSNTHFLYREGEPKPDVVKSEPKGKEGQPDSAKTIEGSVREAEAETRATKAKAKKLLEKPGVIFWPSGEDDVTFEKTEPKEGDVEYRYEKNGLPYRSSEPPKDVSDFNPYRFKDGKWRKIQLDLGSAKDEEKYVIE